MLEISAHEQIKKRKKKKKPVAFYIAGMVLPDDLFFFLLLYAHLFFSFFRSHRYGFFSPDDARDYEVVIFFKTYS